MTGIFLTYFIANIGSYSQLKIESFFPVIRKNLPIESYKIKKLNKKPHCKSHICSVLMVKNVILDSYSFCSLNHCKITVMYFFPIFNKTLLKFPISWVWVLFPKYWEKIPAWWWISEIDWRPHFSYCIYYMQSWFPRYGYTGWPGYILVV